MDGILDIAVLVMALAAIALVGVYTLLTGTPPMPSTRAERAAALDLLGEDPAGVILELGSGLGGLARALAVRYPRSEIIGYERSPLPWLVARLSLAIRPLPNLLFVRSDLRDAPLEEADVIVCYLLGPVMKALGPVLARRLRPGTTVLSVVFALPHWRPSGQTCTAAGTHVSTIYRYGVPESLPQPATG